MHSKFIILGDNFALTYSNLLNFANSCHVYGYIFLLSFNDVGITIAILEQVEVI